MTTSEPAMLDTNILVYASDATSAFHASAKDLRDRGGAGDVLLALSPQILFEFFAVITSPRRVAQPSSPEEAREEVTKYLQSPTILKIYPGEDIINRVTALLQQYPHIARQDIFDCVLVATMQTHGIRHIYTYNRQHFTPFADIEVLTP